MKTAELLHFCLTAKRSGVIKFTFESETGSIFIRDGEVTAAQYSDLNGEEAFFKMLLTEEGTADFFEEDISEPASISKSTHYLLMEAARLSDESSSKLKETPNSSTKPHADDFCLRFITLDNAKFALKGNTVTIGRGNECDITVPDVSVSSKHCQIIWNGRDHMISDSGSANGTYINNEIINQSHTLNIDDNIQVGLCHFCYERLSPDDSLTDPKIAIPFTFGTETQKIQLPPKNESVAPKISPDSSFKEYTPVEDEKRKISIWPFGNRS